MPTFRVLTLFLAIVLFVIAALIDGLMPEAHRAASVLTKAGLAFLAASLLPV